MRITCLGGGPAALLYFAISAKLCDAGHDITVIERDPPGATQLEPISPMSCKREDVPGLQGQASCVS